MGIEFIYQILRTTAVLASIVAFLMFFYLGLMGSLAILAGAWFACVNFFLIKLVLENLLQGRYFKLIAYLTIKFPILYFFGYQILKIKEFPTYCLLVGLSLVFVATFLKTLEGLLWKTS